MVVTSWRGIRPTLI